ncbi:MAG: LCP family protein [Acutalibacteraceae bacterium]|nr:LCP family protein [Acutalibacteraceae bacterium]
MTAENNREAKAPKHKAPQKHKKLIIAVSVVLAVILGLVSAFFIVRKVGENALRKRQENAQTVFPSGNSEALPDDADAYYNGVAYDYNDRLINILLLGVDRNKPNASDSHQADAIYLISLDTDAKTVKVIAVSRNTITEVDTYDINGSYFSTAKQQICLAYTYGNDDKTSSENTLKAVSNFLYGVPISGYYTVFMNSVADIVDAVGGVPVTVTEDLTGIDPRMKIGAEVTVTGKNALSYLQHRGDSNAPRLERQKSFISSFVGRAKSAMLKDLSLPLKMYNKLAENTVTNVTSASAVYLASEALNADFQIIGIEGESGTDGAYETFVPYEDQLYEMILDVFYKKQ